MSYLFSYERDPVTGYAVWSLTRQLNGETVVVAAGSGQISEERARTLAAEAKYADPPLMHRDQHWFGCGANAGAQCTMNCASDFAELPALATHVVERTGLGDVLLRQELGCCDECIDGAQRVVYRTVDRVIAYAMCEPHCERMIGNLSRVRDNTGPCRRGAHVKPCASDLTSGCSCGCTPSRRCWE